MNCHPVRRIILKDLCFLTKVSPDGNLPQQAVSAPSRVAAVGPYIQSSTMPRMPSRPELLVKPALPDGSLLMQSAEGPMKIQTLPNMRSGAASQSKGKSGLSPRPSQSGLPIPLCLPVLSIFKVVFILPPYVKISSSFVLCQ